VYRYVLRLPETLCGSTPAVEFGPLALKAVREAMLGRGYKRTSINKHVHRIRSVFEWAAAQEPPAPLPPVFSDRAVSTAARVSGSFCMCQ
jgi:hypothetical protein